LETLSYLSDFAVEEELGVWGSYGLLLVIPFFFWKSLSIADLASFLASSYF
jgi:hypothetical protein